MRSGKAPVSCIPCAKRKVRCDKQLPCCHCKRRPQDSCEYPSPETTFGTRAEELGERVAHLERLIRDLGGDPDEDTGTGHVEQSAASGISGKSTCTPKSAKNVSKDAPAAIDRPGLLANNEEATYVESPMWYSWGEAKFLQHDSTDSSSRRHALNASSASCDGFIATLLDPIEAPEKTAMNIPPLPIAHLDTLWKIYLKNVHPLIKIFFDWEVEPLIVRARTGESGLSPPEATLVTAICLLATLSVPEEDCLATLKGEKTVLLDHLQGSTEVALRHVGYAVTSNKLTLQAFMLYLQAIRPRAHPAALFSLTGIASRIAERMGIHRDGEILGLSVLRSEERRRMWWQLQYMELTVANQVGALALGVLGKWDAKIPANIDDGELTAQSKTLPPTRTTLTSMSNCLWRYNTLALHRSLREAHSMPSSAGDTVSFIDKIEGMLREKFVRHCELLDPLHVNLQLGICQILVATRRLVCQPALINAKISDMSRHQRDEMLEICLKNLDYCILIQTNELLKGYKWQNSAFFPWAAFIYVILEASHRFEEGSVENIWSTLGRTYETHSELRLGDHRQDVSFAARITVGAWQKYYSHRHGQSPDAASELPRWILGLCETFNLPRPSAGSATRGLETSRDAVPGLAMDFDLDLDMIDWSAWDGAYLDTALFTNQG